MTQTRADSYPIVDAHGHTGSWAGFRVASAEGTELVATLDRCGIACICVSHNLALGVDWQAGNDRTLAAVELHAGRIAGYCVVSPYAPAGETERELDRWLAHPGMCALKFHTELHAYPFSGPGYQPGLEYADAHGLAILTHGWESAQALERVAGQFTKARFILAHAGASYNGRHEDASLRVAQELPNVWVDICGSVTHFGALPRLVDLLGAHKILWGTDCPWFDPGPFLFRVQAGPLSSDIKRRILSDNAIEVLSLESWLKHAPLE